MSACQADSRMLGVASVPEAPGGLQRTENSVLKFNFSYIFRKTSLPYGKEL